MNEGEEHKSARMAKGIPPRGSRYITRIMIIPNSMSGMTGAYIPSLFECCQREVSHLRRDTKPYPDDPFRISDKPCYQNVRESMGV